MTDPMALARAYQDPMRQPSSNRCGARTRTHEGTCRAWPLRGQARCRMHGGSSPQALQRARVRELEAAYLGQMRAARAIAEAARPDYADCLRRHVRDLRQLLADACGRVRPPLGPRRRRQLEVALDEAVAADAWEA